MIIHSGSDLRKASTTSSRRMAHFTLSTYFFDLFFNSRAVVPSRSLPGVLTPSAPIIAKKLLPYFSCFPVFVLRYRPFLQGWYPPPDRSPVGSEIKHLLQSLGDISSNSPIRLEFLEIPIWETGAASSMWPSRSRHSIFHSTTAVTKSLCTLLFIFTAMAFPIPLWSKYFLKTNLPFGL